jgi:hypothetical protein
MRMGSSRIRSSALLLVTILASLPVDAAELDPCHLVTRDEVSRALGATAGAGKVGSLSRRGAEIVGGNCNYRVDNSPTGPSTAFPWIDSYQAAWLSL